MNAALHSEGHVAGESQNYHETEFEASLPDHRQHQSFARFRAEEASWRSLCEQGRDVDRGRVREQTAELTDPRMEEDSSGQGGNREQSGGFL